MPPSSTSRGAPTSITRAAKVFGKVVSASTANLHRVGYLPGDERVERVLDVPYTDRGGKQSFDVYRPIRPPSSTPVPFVFFVHGGGFVIGDRKMGALVGRHLADRGFGVVAAGYRLAPGASLGEQRDDVARALTCVLESAPRLGLDANRYALMGESAGALLAMRLLQELPDVARPRAAIGMYGVYDLGIYRAADSLPLRTFLRTIARDEDVDELVAEHHAVRKLPFTDVPVLLIHGEADRVVPVENSRSLARTLERQGVSVELKTYRGAGHGFNYQKLLAPHHTVDSFHRIADFLRRHVQEPGATPLGPSGAASGGVGVDVR